MSTAKRTAARVLAALHLLVIPALARAQDVVVDRATKYQTIDGFGFFGAMDNWWGNPRDMINDAWASQVLNDLGVTLWRNEYYPPADNLAGQDADWNKQKPVVQTLKRIADANKVPLKFLLTVWSPPSSMKCTCSTSPWLPVEGTAPQSTKGGNCLCKNSWSAFADWLNAGLDMYRQIGVDVYALSFQNEPYFSESYNSTFYLQDYYAQALAYVGPRVKGVFPNVKLFGAENMLQLEAGSDKDYFYTAAINANAGASAALDVIAVHGYSDGVVPTPGSQMSTLWSTLYTHFGQPMYRRIWMTETSGYTDTWTASAVSGTTYPGASDLAYSMYAALYYGHASGWVWWQGSRIGGVDPYSLMAGTSTLSKRYYISKQFFRFIRPGATMVKVTSSDGAVLAAAFEHTAMHTFTAVLINTSNVSKVVNLTGANVAMLNLFRTSASENCADMGTVAASSIVLAPNSVNTLVAGNVYEQLMQVPVVLNPVRDLATVLGVVAAWCTLRRRGGRRRAVTPIARSECSSEGSRHRARRTRSH